MVILFYLQQGDKSVLYPAMTVFVNLSNSYDKPDILPELKEMAKFAKQHVPEDHEKVGGATVLQQPNA